MSVQLHDRLQSVLNAAARLIFTARKTDHITPLLLRDLHWLRVPERVKSSYVCWRTGACLHVTAPPYLADDLVRTSADGNRRHLRSADSPTLVIRPISDAQRSTTVRFPWQLHVLGTVFHQSSGCAFTSVVPEPPENMVFWTDTVTLTSPASLRFVSTLTL